MVKKSKRNAGDISLRTLIVVAAVLLLAVVSLITLVVLEANGVFYKAPERDKITPPKAIGQDLTEGECKYRLLEDGTVMITLYEGAESEILEIPSTLGGYKVSAIGASAYSMLNKVIREVKIPEGVTYIGKGAFTGMENIKLYLPSTIKQIDDMALYGIENSAGVYFAGTEKQWDKVKIGTENKILANIIIQK